MKLRFCLSKIITFNLYFNFHLTARVSEDSFTEDSQKFKLCWKLYNVNIRLFCYYDFFILCHVAEIWPKTSNSAQKWELRKLRSDDFFLKDDDHRWLFDNRNVGVYY